MSCAATTIASAHQWRDESTLAEQANACGERPVRNLLHGFDQLSVIPRHIMGLSGGMMKMIFSTKTRRLLCMSSAKEPPN